MRIMRFNPRAHTGRDAFIYYIMEVHKSFNPRAHTGRDASDMPFAAPSDVSIHAPTRGATSVAESIRLVSDCFNPRAHTGRDALGDS